MKKYISIIIILLGFLPLMAQNDYYIKQAQSYQREAEHYTKQALGYEREVDYYNRQAQGYLRRLRKKSKECPRTCQDYMRKTEYALKRAK